MPRAKRLAALVALGLLAWGAGPGRAGAQPAQVYPGCALDDPSPSPPLAPLVDPIRVDLGSLVLVMDGETSPHDSAYVVELVSELLPEMTEVLGPRVELDELTVRLDGTGSYSCFGDVIRMPGVYPAWEYDDDRDGAIDEDPFDGIDNDGDGEVDEDLPNAPGWDAVFAHELAHAFQGDLVCHGYPRWFTEGMAEAAAWLVAERLASRGGRHLLGSAFNLDLGRDDLLDRQGAPVLGGGGRPIDRPSSSMAYAAAGGTLLMPCLAEAASGRARPMTRLTEALRANLPSAQVFDTVDRVFLSPVDGVLPVSRWMQQRSVVCPSVADGEFLAIRFPVLTLNPERVGFLYFSRQGSEISFMRLSGLPTFTGVHGGEIRAAELTFVPDLAPGAWRVRQQETGTAGSTHTANSWLLMVRDAVKRNLPKTAVAAIFVDPSGNPVEVSGLSVDGAMIERVPGGCVVEPGDGLGSVTFRDRSGVFGSALAVPSHLRVVVIPVDPEPDRGVVSWTPYHPQAGGELEVVLRRGMSALAADAGPIDAVLRGWSGLRREAEEVWEGPGDRVTARFVVPVEMEVGEVSFVGAEGHHDSPWDGVLIRGERGPAVVEVHREEGFLRLEFDGAPELSTLVLEVAEGAAGPWSSSGTLPVAGSDSGRQLRWPLPTDARWRLARVRDTEFASARVLCTVQLSPGFMTLSNVAFAPFPNPSDLGALWRVDLAAAAEVTFAVFDVAGRRVHGPERVWLRAGRNELWWDGRSLERRVPGGVYLLRVDGSGFAFRNRVILLPR